MYININTAEDNPRELRAAQAAIQILLGEGPSVNTPKQPDEVLKHDEPVAEADAPALPKGQPNADWKNDQITAYAEAHDIDLAGAYKKADMLAIINGDAEEPEDEEEPATEEPEDDEEEEEAPEPKKAPVKKAKDEDEDPRQEAVAYATELVSKGKSAFLKSVLSKFGAKRVSEVPDKKLAEFMETLEAGE